ncbi:MAG: DUF6082 family protein [Gammaproteobacteria bacterium]
MNLQQWSFVAEIASSIAVVLSLCFLAVELRLYVKQAQQDSVDQITSRRHDLLRTMAVDGELADIVWKALAGTPRVPTDDWARFAFFMYTMVLEYERAWLKYEAGLIDQQVLKTWDQSLAWWLQHPGARNWWRGDHPGFHAGFTTYMDGVISRVIINPDIASAVAAAIRDRGHPQPAYSTPGVTDPSETTGTGAGQPHLRTDAK